MLHTVPQSEQQHEVPILQQPQKEATGVVAGVIAGPQTRSLELHFAVPCRSWRAMVLFLSIDRNIRDSASVFISDGLLCAHFWTFFSQQVEAPK